MKPELPPVLVVDDEKNMRLSLQTMLSAEGYGVCLEDSAEGALRRIEREPWLMVITDARLGGMSGYELVRKTRELRPGLPILMITAYATPKLAVEAIQSGAMDYLPKPFAPEELLHAVSRCVERYQLIRENTRLRQASGGLISLDQIVGGSPGMRELRRLIQTVAPTDARILILGESGTGKELVAGALHALSQRRHKPFIRINCAAIPEALLESELFGHERGAFTGAVRQKAGRVEEADGGTLFLDEIADMSHPLQAKLLRFLEDGSFTRVGGTQELRVNVRLIAATNRNIVAAIGQGQFREDLFHRLNVVQLRLPPLRDRDEDVLVLAAHFLRQLGPAINARVRSLSPAARQKLLAHRWPGNVRELRNALERALILETTPQIQAESLPDFRLEQRLAPAPAPDAPPATGSLDAILAHHERQAIEQALARNRFSLTRAADQLEISRHALRYRMQRLRIQPGAEPEPEPPPPQRPPRQGEV
ncbi:MAG: sigma-54 dependent transcriptional regulator [Verrucomicrobia bacterium]|jgi:DNA-binding NtrC family response regulator|nr:sigma-54 dependent transcriptional regulator [Verrucomicrobiota bacterium]